MPIALDDFVTGLRESRTFFLKHLKGLALEQWDWKPYPECKSIRETLGHLVADDRAAIESLATGKEPDYETLAALETAPARLADLDALLSRLDESHASLCEHITAHYAGRPLDDTICVFGGMRKLGPGVAYFSSEDFYHAGQVAYIRMATDPTWDYYAHVYGG